MEVVTSQKWPSEALKLVSEVERLRLRASKGVALAQLCALSSYWKYVYFHYTLL